MSERMAVIASPLGRGNPTKRSSNGSHSLDRKSETVKKEGAVKPLGKGRPTLG